MYRLTISTLRRPVCALGGAIGAGAAEFCPVECGEPSDGIHGGAGEVPARSSGTATGLHSHSSARAGVEAVEEVLSVLSRAYHLHQEGTDRIDIRISQC